MRKKLLIVFSCLVILFIQCIPLHSLSNSGLKEELHIINELKPNQANIMDKYSELIPFIWLFFIFLGMFIVSYEIIIRYRKKHFKKNEEVPPIYDWKDHL